MIKELFVLFIGAVFIGLACGILISSINLSLVISGVIAVIWGITVAEMFKKGE